MSAPRDAFESHIYTGQEELPGRIHALGTGRAWLYSRRDPEKSSENEDALGILCTGPARGVAALADGVGGAPGGAAASAIAIECMFDAIRRALERDLEPRYGVLDGFEVANREVLARAPGAATTLIVAVVDGATVRTFHVGDSFMLVVGQRGKLKRETLAHSPTGYGVAAGLLDEDEALRHSERHVISNYLGSGDMHVEVSARIALAPRDTMVLASDGLSDNLPAREIAELVRKGPLDRAAASLAGAARSRMLATGDSAPSKPDDLTLVVFRVS